MNSFKSPLVQESGCKVSENLTAGSQEPVLGDLSRPQFEYKHLRNGVAEL